MIQKDIYFVGPVNLGNPVELSMNDLANKIIKLFENLWIRNHRLTLF